MHLFHAMGWRLAFGQDADQMRPRASRPISRCVDADDDTGFGPIVRATRVTKSAYLFGRFGGACPLWIVHEAVAIPDRILVQLAETPDGVRYVSMAKGLVKPSGGFDRPTRRYAVALGCEADHAGDFIYADGLSTQAAATPIGSGVGLASGTPTTLSRG